VVEDCKNVKLETVTDGGPRKGCNFT